jgi:hypothetical protein
MRNDGRVESVNVATPLELTVGIGGFFGPWYQIGVVGSDIEYTFSLKSQSFEEGSVAGWRSGEGAIINSFMPSPAVSISA